MAKLNLRIKSSSKSNCSILKKQQRTREKQLKDAVKYCIDNGVKGYKAISSGMFPLIKDPRTINKRLDGYNTGSEKEYCR